MPAEKLMAHSVLRTVAALAVAAGGLTLLATRQTDAQVITLGASSRAPARAGGVTDRDRDALISTLGLDKSQEELVRALHEGHRAAWDEAREAHREQTQATFQAAKASGDFQSLGSKMRTAQQEWTRQNAALEEEFFTNVKGLLGDDQLAAWPRFERDRRRRTLLATQSRLSGEGVDLIDVADSIDLAAETLARLEPVSEQYASEADLGIAERTRAIEAVEKAMEPAMEGSPEEVDPAAIEELRLKLHGRRLALRDLHARYATLFESHLTEQQAASFREQFRLRSFPRIYRPTAADRYLEQIEGLDSLNEEQQRSLAGLSGDFGRQVGLINDQLAEIVRSEEESPPGAGGFFGEGPSGLIFGDEAGPQIELDAGESQSAVLVMRSELVAAPPQPGVRTTRPEPATPQIFTFGAPAEDEDSPRGKLSRSKRDLVSRTIESAYALLTPEQQALAPKPDDDQRLSPEERVQHRLRRALEGAVIETSGEGGQNITITVESSEDK